MACEPSSPTEMRADKSLRREEADLGVPAVEWDEFFGPPVRKGELPAKSWEIPNPCATTKGSRIGGKGLLQTEPISDRCVVEDGTSGKSSFASDDGLLGIQSRKVVRKDAPGTRR